MVEVRCVRSSDEADRALDLAERVWGVRPITAPMLRALEFAGCYVSVAVDGGGHPIGMCAGFVGLHDTGEGTGTGTELHLHSHLAAVDPGHRGRGIGRSLKRHQREWCLARGIEHVSWTFDPLVVENARFNLHHLGASGHRYLANLYGEMDDEINRGDPTDRLLVWWDLDSERARAALDGPLPAPDPSRAEVLVPTPTDIVGLRRHDPDAARRWRVEVREAIVDALDRGLCLAGVTDDGQYAFTTEDR